MTFSWDRVKEINVNPLGIASCIHNCIKQQGKAGRCLDVYMYPDLKYGEYASRHYLWLNTSVNIGAWIYNTVYQIYILEKFCTFTLYNIW